MNETRWHIAGGIQGSRSSSSWQQIPTQNKRFDICFSCSVCAYPSLQCNPHENTSLYTMQPFHNVVLQGISYRPWVKNMVALEFIIPLTIFFRTWNCRCSSVLEYIAIAIQNSNLFVNVWYHLPETGGFQPLTLECYRRWSSCLIFHIL